MTPTPPAMRLTQGEIRIAFVLLFMFWLLSIVSFSQTLKTRPADAPSDAKYAAVKAQFDHAIAAHDMPKVQEYGDQLTAMNQAGLADDTAALQRVYTAIGQATNPPPKPKSWLRRWWDAL